MTDATTGSPWSDAERDRLAQMWLCGCRSPQIALATGRTRNAVMGRINKSRLMGRRGAGIMGAGLPPADVQRVVDDTIDDVMGRPRRPGALDDACAVMLAMAACGRDSDDLADVSRVDAALIESVARTLDVTKTWPLGAGPPSTWWTKGAASFLETATDVVRAMPPVFTVLAA